jgi:hypothetical protein
MDSTNYNLDKYRSMIEALNKRKTNYTGEVGS